MSNLQERDGLLELWFSERVQPLWFNSTPEFDQELKTKFEKLYQSAVAGELDSWQESIEGLLALAILFDQIPLNIYRRQPQSFATEARAREVASRAIAKGWDSQLNDRQRMFLYMPFMHSERMEDQDRSVELFEKAGMKDNAQYARHHRKIVARFSRFPHRNAILGRESTPEELEYLASDKAFTG